MYQSILSGGVAVWLGGGGIFENAGLCLAIIDRVASASKKQMADADNDKKKLLEAAEKTGIRKRIEKAREDYRKMAEVETGRRCYDPKFDYFALTPKWKFPSDKTKYKVVFWLNPTHQDKVNYGWFTVEELDLWLENKGPIPKCTA